MRQRVHVGATWRTTLGKLLTAVVALAVAWFGLSLLLVALGVAPDDVDRALGYRTAYDAVAGLDGTGLDTTYRIALGAGGIVLCLVLLALAWAQVPRPELTRHDVDLPAADPTAGPGGETTVQARAVERAAEVATLSVAGIDAARARLDGTEVVVALRSTKPTDLPDQLRAAQAAARDALTDHGLQGFDARVVLAGFDKEDIR